MTIVGMTSKYDKHKMLETIETLFSFSIIHLVVVLVVVLVVITTAITYNYDLTTGSYLLCACVKATVPKNMNELWISTLDKDAMVNNIMVVKSLVTSIVYVVVVIWTH